MMLGALSEIIPYIINGILGIIKINILITFLGNEMNGYYQFINQVITYLFLMEAGFTSAVTFQLYKPFADGDHKKVREIYTGSREIFKKIGLIIGILVVGAVIILPFTMHIESSKLIQVLGTFILICAAYLIPFFGKQNAYEAALSSDQHSYIFASVFNGFKIINDILIIIFVIFSRNLLMIGLSIFIIKLIEEVVFRLIGKHIYPWLKETEIKDMKALDMTKDVAWNKFGYLIANNIDSVIVMYILGPVSVSIYGTYNYVASYLSELISRLNGIVSLTFGNVFAKGEKKRSYKLFKEYYTLIIIIAFIAALTFYIGIRPFIGVWIKDALYMIRQVDVLMFTLCLFFTILFFPLHSIINANGLYKVSKNYVFIAALVNIIFSLLLVKPFGFAGLLGATAFSYLISNYLKCRLIYKQVFNYKDLKQMLLEYGICIILFIGIAFLSAPVEQLLFTNCTNFFTCLLGIGLLFIVISILTIIVLLVVKKNTRDLFHRLFSLFKKNLVNSKKI